jgi:hypothetical protein
LKFDQLPLHAFQRGNGGRGIGGIRGAQRVDSDPTQAGDDEQEQAKRMVASFHGLDLGIQINPTATDGGVKFAKTMEDFIYCSEL